MRILKETEELVQAGILPQETADRIAAYYKAKEERHPNRLMLVFGLLGALLCGLGIILIVAHNWDNFSRPVKTSFAFLPLLLGQAICAYTLLRQQNSAAWREASAVFLSLAVGGSISLVSQIYNIPGNIGVFMLSWSLLCLPLVYILKSSAVSLLYVVGICAYAMHQGFEVHSADRHIRHLHWLLLAGIGLHYYGLIRQNPGSNFTAFHHWFLAAAGMLLLWVSVHGDNNSDLMRTAFMSLFGFYSIIGSAAWFEKQHSAANAYRITGALATVVLLLVLSFDTFWHKSDVHSYAFGDLFTQTSGLATILLTLGAVYVLYRQMKSGSANALNPFNLSFLAFHVVVSAGVMSESLPPLLVNLLLLTLGILNIRAGAQKNHLGILNTGLLIVMALVICKFFDTQISFVLRGLMFVLAGTGFFVANIRMLKKRRADGQA